MQVCIKLTFCVLLNDAAEQFSDVILQGWIAVTAEAELQKTS